MTEPKRIQRKRTKGWRMPENAVYVGRPSKWGNPYRVHHPAGAPVHSFGVISRFETVELFRANFFYSGLDVSELRGKDLACWCKESEPCHADVLLEWANA